MEGRQSPDASRFDTALRDVRKVRAFLVVAATVAGVLAVSQSARAATLSTSVGKSSCVQAYDGKPASGWTWAAGETITLRMKCYYDMRTPVDTYRPAGSVSGATWFSGSPAINTSWKMMLGRNAGNADCLDPASGGTNWWRWSNVVVDQQDAAKGYVELHVTLTGHPTVGRSMGAGTNPFVNWEPTGCSNGSQARYLGANASMIGSSTVAGDAFATTMPDFRWGSSDWTAVSPFCGATVTATTITLPDGSTKAAANSSLVQTGDKVTFSVAWSSSITQSVDVSFHPGGAGSSYVSLYNGLAGGIVNPEIVTVTVPALTAAVRLGGILLRCHDAASGQNYYKSLEQAGVGTNDVRGRGCDIARWFKPEDKSLAVGDTVPFTLNYSGVLPEGQTPTTIKVEYAVFDIDNLPRVPAFSSLTWTTLVEAAPLGTFTTYNVTAGYAGPVQQFVFRCTDALGTVYNNQWTNPADVLSGTVPAQDEGCIKSSGLGLSPSSWVGGLMRIGSCLLKALFIPSEVVIDAFKTDAKAAMESHAPSNYVGQVIPLATGTFSGLSAGIMGAHDACFVALPEMGVPGIGGSGGQIDEQQICGDDIPTNPTARVILLFLFWLAFGWKMVGLVGVILKGGNTMGVVGSFLHASRSANEGA